MRSARRKRASAEDLYRSCKQGGDCIPDVVQKFEHNTVADNILKWGSTAVYFGGLGIGTGGARPTQPTAGWQIPREVPYRPLPGGAGRPTTGWQIPREGVFQLPRPSRPTLSGGSVVDTISPGDFSISNSSDVTVGAGNIGPDAPSVILPETVPAHTDTVGLSVVTELPDTVHVTVDPNGAAVLEIPPSENADRITTLTTKTGTSKATYQVESSTTIIGETSESSNVFVNGNNVGGDTGESIELHTYSGPHTSTPDTLPRSRVRGINNYFSTRYYTQVQVSDTEFLLNPRSYVTEGYFDNPVFENDLDESIGLPEDDRPFPKNPDFLDIGRLSRPQFTKSPGGTLGVSPIGTKFSLKTRSGLSFGRQVHFRLPIEPIEEEIELEEIPLSGADGAEQVDQGVLREADTFFGGVSESDLVERVSESDLVDAEERLPLGHLSFLSQGELQHIPIDDMEGELSYVTETDTLTTLGLPKDIGDNAESIGADVPEDRGTQSTKRKQSPLVELQPGIFIDANIEDCFFYWFPHLFQRRKKRKLWSLFTDGAVDTRA